MTFGNFCRSVTIAATLFLSAGTSGAETPMADAAQMNRFLDRLMMAESGGRDTVANPLSTAVGAFQFIVPTWLDVTRRHFAAEIAGKTPVQILMMRTERAFARRAAEAYTRDNAAVLVAAGLPATWPNLRLAFLLGPNGAVRVVSSAAPAPLTALMSKPVIAANPWMARLTAGDLVQRAARDVGIAADDPSAATPSKVAGLTARPKRPAIPLRCDLSLPSCRKWLALAETRLLGKATTVRVARKRA